MTTSNRRPADVDTVPRVFDRKPRPRSLYAPVGMVRLDLPRAVRRGDTAPRLPGSEVGAERDTGATRPFGIHRSDDS
jgi:hypothetical protein